MARDNSSAPASTATLGTFGGVFTPSVLTILGLVLFLRVAYVVGSVGLVRALIILALATSVSVLTSISLAAMATNMKVQGGGEYFLISRTLGVEYGGAIGVVLYLAISVSIAFYCIGFAEAVVAEFSDNTGAIIQLVAVGLVFALAGIAAVGADLATRLQYLVMTLLVVALLSFFVGAAGDFDTQILSDNLGQPDSDVGFWEAFAIFFPSVTGFSQGVAMSGELKEPSKSITTGTFAAVGLSTVVYLATVFLLSGAAPAATLAEETTTIMGDLSLFGWTLIVGVLAATLSSALASTLGAPRVLQRLGEDRVLPRLEVFAEGAGPLNNPRKALVLSVVVALATVAAGDLNAIAPIISMFFLASYALINYATYFEIRAGSTSFRPRFRWYDYRASLVGTIACAAAIVAINPIAGAVAGLAFLGLFLYLRRRDVPERWTDSAGAYQYTRARHHVQNLAEEQVGSRDWRPCILAFVPRDPKSRYRMVELSSWLEGNSGYLTAVRIIEGSGPVLRRQAREIQEDLTDEVSDTAPGSFARVMLVDDSAVGVQALVQGHGVGTIKPNLTIFGVRDLRGSDDDRQVYSKMLQNCVRFGTNVAVINVREDAWHKFEETKPEDRQIALWWSDDQEGQLITLLGWLCQRHDAWSRAAIVVYVPQKVGDDDADRVAQRLKDARITAEVRKVDETPAALTTALGSATMAFAPLRVRRGAAIGPFETPLGMLVESLPLAVLILASEQVDIDAEADDGDLAEYAKISDQLSGARKWAAELDSKASTALVKAETIRMKLDAMKESDDGYEGATEMLEEAESEAAKRYREYVSARTRVAEVEARAKQLRPDKSASAISEHIWRSSESVKAPDGKPE